MLHIQSTHKSTINETKYYIATDSTNPLKNTVMTISPLLSRRTHYGSSVKCISKLREGNLWKVNHW